jgi:hypothetical protein
MPQLHNSKPIAVTDGGASRRWKYVTPLMRFEGNYIPEPNSGCWLWLGQLNANGYGQMMIGYRQVFAHRFSYQTFKAPLIDGLVIDHLCCNRCCVNPDHLDQVTQSVNVSRIPLSTECSRGHPWTVETTWVNPKNGWRQCRQCNRDNQKRLAERRRMA